MKKLLLLIVFSFSILWVQAQQVIQLFVEDFEQADSAFVVDTGSFGPQIGNNKWVINNQYNGTGGYPTTTRQDSVYFGNGTITGAPFSKYLHINNDGVNTNDVFDPSSASDRFIYKRDGFCTLGLTDVKLVFFYLVEGDTVNLPPTAYGQVYYSVNGGPWILTGDSLYYHQTKWRYEQISDTAFNNKQDLRFGYRWVNAGNSIAKTIAFGIDDIQVVGTYDSTVNNISANVDQVFSSPTCRNSILTFHWKLTDFLCDGSYQIQLSNGSGNFIPRPVTQSITINYPDTSGYTSILIPDTLPAGNCYRIRLVRTSPFPIIYGAPSPCIQVINCPNTITTLTPVVLTDPDTACIKSAIDVKFYSTGAFNTGNVYTALISDSNGNFGSAATVVGTLPSKNAYDPNLPPYQPGTVSGLIPNVPAGCGYYIKVISSNPVDTIGTIAGPFCLKQCDITTDSTRDYQFCINEVSGDDTTLFIDIHSWDTTTHYSSNSFKVQVLSNMTLAVINTGGLGVYYDSVSGVFQITVPKLSDLLALGIQPGSYYCRIVADGSSTSPYDTTGTIIRLTIGAPSVNPPDIITDPDVACNSGSDPITYTVDPYNPDSHYYWLAPFTTYGATPFEWPYPTLGVSLGSGAPAGLYTVRVREYNYGCYGPFSDTASIFVITASVGDIIAPPKACLGDTVQFSVPFYPSTYYTWGSSWGTIIDTSNNEISAVYDSTGSVTVYVSALNACGQGASSITINAVSLVNVTVDKDTSVCRGETVQLTASTPGIQNFLTTSFTTQNNSPYYGSMFDLVARRDLTINSFDGNFFSSGALSGLIPVKIYYKTGSFAGFEQDSTAWTFLDSAVVTVPNPQGTATPIPITANIAVAANDTIAFYITETDGKKRVENIVATNYPSPFATDSILEAYKGSANAYKFGAFTINRMWSGNIHYTTLEGLVYQWSNGDSTQNTFVRPDTTTDFMVRVSDTTGCGNNGMAKVTILPTPVVSVGDSQHICFGKTVQVHATAVGSYHWEPTTGLPDSTALDFALTPDSSVAYVLVVSDPNLTCVGKDTLKITVVEPTSESDTDSVCTDKPTILTLPDVPGGGYYYWSTGDTGQTLTVIKAGTYVGYYRPLTDSCVSQIVFQLSEYDCNVNIQVPQAFTPNNDGTNDHFTVFGKNVVDYEIRIYNRWGELVYNSTDVSELNDLNKGWDGTHHGKLQNVGTYVYYIKGTDDGGKGFEKHGNLTLIR